MGTPTLRPVKSCESLTSDTDTLAPLAERAIVPLKHHTRYVTLAPARGFTRVVPGQKVAYVSIQPPYSLSY